MSIYHIEIKSLLDAISFYREKGAFSVQDAYLVGFKMISASEDVTDVGERSLHKYLRDMGVKITKETGDGRFIPFNSDPDCESIALTIEEVCKRLRSELNSSSPNISS